MKTKRKRFTLIEALLLTFGILLLSFLIIPAVTIGTPRCGGARKISCMNNLKQIGLSARMYSTVYSEDYPHLNGRSGLYMLATEGFLENTNVYRCPSTNDIIKTMEDIPGNASYAYAGGLNEAVSVDSGLASDRANNHDRYGNILFIDGHVKGYAGTNWSSNRGDSILTDF